MKPLAGDSTRRALIRTVGAACALSALLTPASSLARRGTRHTDFPRLVLWAWERPERLTTIDPRTTGVAFLARTYLLSGDRLVARPRMQPLDIPAGTALMAVARIETDRDAPPRFSQERTERLAQELAGMTVHPGVRGIQIDFDALRSERPFYCALITATRAALDPRVPLSITALASWCMHDGWIDDLPIDEAVPMLFSMGPGEGHTFRSIAEGNAWRVARCRTSLGVSTAEPLAHERDGRRVYVFHPTAWNPAIAAATALDHGAVSIDGRISQ